MSTLAAQGHRVLFVENTGVRRPRLSDLPRVRQRLRNWWRGTNGFRQERENLFVYSPVVLPFPYSRAATLVNRTLLLRALGRWMRAAQAGDRLRRRAASGGGSGARGRRRGSAARCELCIHRTSAKRCISAGPPPERASARRQTA